MIEPILTVLFAGTACYLSYRLGYNKAKSEEKRIIRDAKGRFVGYTKWKEKRK